MSVALRLIRCLPPETAHRLGILALKYDMLSSAPVMALPALRTEALGMTFPHPLGMAAGFDKNAEAMEAALKQGFGFVEVGTITPKPQPGNPKPRIFRLSQDEAVINRLGFNSEGMDACARRLGRRDPAWGIVGVNLGKNKESEDASADFTRGIKAAYAHADYFTVNISSPNTPGLRALQKRDALAKLLTAIAEMRHECETVHGRRVPLLLKISPDISTEEAEDITHLATAHALDGLIVGNTTLARPGDLRSPLKNEAGGLSGCPLFAPSTELLKQFYRLTGGKLLLVGTGGIGSAAEAYAKIRAGATLLQLYTALVYKGFAVAREIPLGLAQLLEADGFTHVSQAIGIDAR